MMMVMMLVLAGAGAGCWGWVPSDAGLCRQWPVWSWAWMQLYCLSPPPQRCTGPRPGLTSCGHVLVPAKTWTAYPGKPAALGRRAESAASIGPLRQGCPGASAKAGGSGPPTCQCNSPPILSKSSPPATSTCGSARQTPVSRLVSTTCHPATTTWLSNAPAVCVISTSRTVLFHYGSFLNTSQSFAFSWRCLQRGIDMEMDNKCASCWLC